MLTANREEHGILRRQLSAGFSEKAMRAQAPLIDEYANLLIRQLHKYCENGKVALNMKNWYNWTTFDIIGDLGFGSPFGSLRNASYHPWIEIITETIREGAFVRAMNHLGLQSVVLQLYRSGLMKDHENMELVRHKLNDRVNLGVERDDLIEALIKKKDESYLGPDRLAENANLLIIAGSETTATVLCGVTWLLTTHPDKLAKLVAEVRSTFKSDEEINLISVGSLT